MRTPLVIAIAAFVALFSSVATVGADRLLTGQDIKDGSLTGRDIRNGSLTGVDIKPGSIPVNRIERAGRNHVYRSTMRSTRAQQVPTAIIPASTYANIMTVTVPAGQYVIQGSVTPQVSTANTSIKCSITDTANKLTTVNNGAQWLTQVANEQLITLPVFATASYTGTTNISLTCVGYDNSATAYWPTLIAEQVTLVN